MRPKNFRACKAHLGIAVLAAFMLALTALAAAQKPGMRPEFSLVQLNDIYRIDTVENGNAGGMSRVATLLQRTKGPVFILHAGDFIAPSLESKYFAGQQMIAAMNFLHRLAPMYVTPGNHEFDEKPPQMFMQALRASQFTWLAANLKLSTPEPELNNKIAGHTLVTMGKTKVGIFGLTIHGAQNGKDRDYAAVDSNYLALAERELQALEAAGAEVIIGLTHLSIEEDRQIAKLRRQHPKFMWIAGGHEHYAQQEEMSTESALITKGDSNARTIWRVQFGRENGQVALAAEKLKVDAAIPLDKLYQKEVAEHYRAELEKKLPFLNDKIGASETVLHATEEAVRTGESAWGNYLTDLMRNAFGNMRADVAILNGGAIRIDDNFSGEIRFEHLWRTFGFATRVAYVWLKGKDLKQDILEHAVAAEPGNGRFLQVSGLKFEYDRRQKVGERVRNVKVACGSGWNCVDDNQIYIVAVPDYLYEGGDGYAFKTKAVMSIPPGPELRLLTFEAISDAYAKGKAIAPVVEGRIVEIK